MDEVVLAPGIAGRCPACGCYRRGKARKMNYAAAQKLLDENYGSLRKIAKAIGITPQAVSSAVRRGTLVRGRVK